MGTSSQRKAARRAPGSWPDERGTDPSGALPSLWPERLTDAVVAEARGLSPGPAGLGEPAWERWFDRALEEGVEEDLASLGRSVMQAAHEQRWSGERAADAGLLDDGEALLDLALLDPAAAAARLQALLDAE